MKNENRTHVTLRDLRKLGVLVEPVSYEIESYDGHVRLVKAMDVLDLPIRGIFADGDVLHVHYWQVDLNEVTL